MNKNIYTLKDFIKDHKNAKVIIYDCSKGATVAYNQNYDSFEVDEVEYLGYNRYYIVLCM